MMKSKRMINGITEKIIGAALEVHKALGPGLLESAYEACMAAELAIRGLSFDRQKAIPVIYKNVNLDCGYRLDFLVENAVVVEIKAVEEIARVHQAQLLSYLKLSGYKVGLLINFNVKLLKTGIKRMVHNL